MSAKGRDAIKADFVSGTAATEDKFVDLVDSARNMVDDYLMLAASGHTGTYGMVGPTGGTANGLVGPTGATFYTGMYLVAPPAGPTSAGNAYQVAAAGGTFYFHDGDYWNAVAGTTAF